MQAVRWRVWVGVAVATVVLCGVASIAAADAPHGLAFESTVAEGGGSPQYATPVTFDTMLRDTTTGDPLSGALVQLQMSPDCRSWSAVASAIGRVDPGGYSATVTPPNTAESYFRFSVAATAGTGAAVSPLIKIAPQNGLAAWSGVAAKVGPYWSGGAASTRIVAAKPFTSLSISGWLVYSRPSPVLGSAGVVECSADGVSYHRAQGSTLAIWRSLAADQSDYRGYLHSGYGTFYRLSSVPIGASGPSVSSAVTVISPRALFVSASKAKVKRGKVQTLHGYFWPEAPRGAKTAQIEVRRRSGSKWVLVGIYRPVNSARKDYSSAFAYNLRITRRGQYRYRAITPATAYCVRTVTAYKRFTVY